MTRRNRIIVLLLVGLLQACAAPVAEPERTGFVSDYSRLESVGDQAWLYTNPRVAEYSRFRIDGPTILCHAGVEGSEQCTQAELDELPACFRERIDRAHRQLAVSSKGGDSPRGLYWKKKGAEYGQSTR